MQRDTLRDILGTENCKRAMSYISLLVHKMYIKPYFKFLKCVCSFYSDGFISINMYI